MNMKKYAKVLLPLIVLLSGAAIAAALVNLRPAVERREVVIPPPLVRVMTVAPHDVELVVRAQGTVTPGIESTLVAQVAGRVEWVSPQFADGGLFRHGVALLRLEDSDQKLAVSRAEAQLARARTSLELQQAEAEQARRDWDDLGRGEPTALTLRQPQLAQARAELQGAEASLEQARLDLARTRITAPYDGRIRATRVDVGQFVAPGTPLAEVFSTEYAEIRLPVTKDELGFLDLDLSAAAQSATPVELSGELAGDLHTWPATIVRASGELDPQTRMLPLFARIDDPFGHDGGRAPLPMGLYVDAAIRGRALAGAVVLPRSALRGESEVLVVDGEERLRFRTVEVARVERDDVVIQAGLEAGERVCVSPLETVIDGMPVRSVEDEPGPAAERGDLL